MPHVFDMLKEDHREVERMFSQFEASNDPNVAREICDELTLHSIIEEELVYGLLASKVSNGMAKEARDEHAEAAQIIEQIDAGLSSGSDVSGLVAQLKQSVQHHVQEEESEIFPKMQEEVPSLVEPMGEEVATRKEEIRKEIREARSLGEPVGVVAQRPPGH
jgi:hemerythrin-like domain-containing protein